MDESKAAPKKTQGGARGEVYDWIQCIIAALIFCVLLFVFVARMVNVVGSSMYPTLEENDKMIISNLCAEAGRHCRAAQGVVYG